MKPLKQFRIASKILAIHELILRRNRPKYLTGENRRKRVDKKESKDCPFKVLF